MSFQSWKEFADFFVVTAPVTAGIVAGTWAPNWGAANGVAFGSKAVWKTIAGKSYTKYGLIGCLTDLLCLDATMVEDILKRGEITHKESPQISWLNERSCFL